MEVEAYTCSVVFKRERTTPLSVLSKSRQVIDRPYLRVANCTVGFNSDHTCGRSCLTKYRIRFRAAPGRAGRQRDHTDLMRERARDFESQRERARETEIRKCVRDRIEPGKEE